MENKFYETVDLMSKFMEMSMKGLESLCVDVFGTRLGLVILMFPFEHTDQEVVAKREDGIGANYISNGQVKDCIKLLRETANRLEKNQIIPPAIGSA